ncbi:M28 family metallopeptidase [Rhizobium leguminosarum]|uniref:M28 family metallopeptidase n=1 Tax=Rhizobium leguminosarum TaxID=384 RepID=UPI0012375232|nr:M28 family metallopeptidase [Rhizobium leguminosarum]
MIGITPYSYITSVLGRKDLVRGSVGIISTIPDVDEISITEALKTSNLFGISTLNSGRVVARSTKNMALRDGFLRASNLAGSSSKVCFVSEDAWLRSVASSVGMMVCPHPLLIPTDWQERFRYVRIRTPLRAREDDLRTIVSQIPFVPLHVGSGETIEVIGITTGAGASMLANARVEVDLLGPVDAPLLNDLYLLRDDRAVRTGYLSYDGQSSRFSGGEDADRLLLATRDGLLVALPGGTSVEGYHFEEARHGHNLKLTADVSLIERIDLQPGTASFLQTGIDVTSLDLDEQELEIFASLSSSGIQPVVDRLSGKAPLRDGKMVQSRHIQSDDNIRAVREIAARLSSLSSEIDVSLHAFTHEGQTLYNVEAELPSQKTSEIVLVTAHLDSTAAFGTDFDPVNGIAPGADDDASGVAAVEAIASVILKLRSITPLRRTIRFVLFNAEEHGLVGSKAYAKQQADSLAMIVAVLQMDMIGYNVKPPRSWEVHAGYWPAPDVQRRSLALAATVKKMSRLVSRDLDLPQLYSSKKNKRDEAEGRSDHASFHERGYAACVASEDFFPTPTPEDPMPDSEGNPAYHRPEDTLIDAVYAADIARVIAATAWVLSRQQPATQQAASRLHNWGRQVKRED